MTKVLKVTLASAMLIASSSVAFAADRGMDGRTPNGTNPGFTDKGRSSEQQELLDYGTTGSIYRCETGMWDQYGNCLMDPGYLEPMR